jgi:acetoacetyl-CoA synthetase
VEGFEWVYSKVGGVWLFSTSGGTDLCTAFVGACPLLPVRAGELQARALGASVESWSEDGRPLIDEVGELVITKPMPSMPLFFWNDPNGDRYRESYFEMFPGVWRHGDWIKITPRGSAVIYGRSDSTINRGGVRMGTSEIYSAVEAVPQVQDSLVVDVDDRIVLFVVTEGELDESLAGEIKKRVREHCSPRHTPDAIHRIDEVPRTLSNKKLEVPVKRILLGTPAEKAASRDSLANPAALDWFVERAGELSGTR